jgi:hypothetical protein
MQRIWIIWGLLGIILSFQQGYGSESDCKLTRRAESGLSRLCGVRLPSESVFESLSAVQKQRVMMEVMRSGAYSWLTGPIYQAIHFASVAMSAGKLFSPNDLTSTFDLELGDLRAHPFLKRIHGIGYVIPVKIKFKTSGINRYSGVFNADQELFAVLRASLAGPHLPTAARKLMGKLPFDSAKKFNGMGFVPGFGLKIFIDGNPSVNIMAMNHLLGQVESGFSRYPFSNSLVSSGGGDKASASILVEAFQRAIDLLDSSGNNRPTYLSLKHMAAVQSDGMDVPSDARSTPELIVFLPTKAFQDYENTRHTLRGTLTGIPDGLKIYDIWLGGHRDRPIPPRTHLIPMDLASIYGLELAGHVISNGSGIPSLAGDRHLFMGHALETP